MKHTVVVTGGTKGLGREISLAFARLGHSVIALYANDSQAAERIESEFTNMGSTSVVLKHDVTSDSHALKNCPLLKDAESLVFIHNACADFTPVPLHQLSWNDFEKNLSVTVKGAWLCSQELIRPMLKHKRGVIVSVLTSAIHGLPPKGFGAYATAKHALRGFTLALASEYSARGLKVFSISPSYMDTPLTEQWDFRLRDAIRSSGPITTPEVAARKLVELVQSNSTLGSGEDYPV